MTISQGFNADFSEWTCAWNNPSFELSATVRALCLRPPTPGTATVSHPAEDRLKYVSKTETITPTGNNQINTTCDPGDTLIYGSCVIESATAHPTIQIMYSGPPDETENRPNTWQCAWHNPSDTGTLATGVVTAVCLSPPPA